MDESNKKPSGKLIIGIVLIPIIFAWFSLKKGYSNKFKIISMAWMLLTILLAVLTPSSETTTDSVKIITAPQIPKQEAKSIDPSLLAVDCKLAKKMVDATAPLFSKAVKLQNNNADYQEIAQWRVNTFNSAIKQIQSKYSLSPQDMTNPALEVSRTVNNDVLNTVWFYVHELFSQSRYGDNEEMVKLKLTTINEGIQFYKDKCTNTKE